MTSKQIDSLITMIIEHNKLTSDQIDQIFSFDTIKDVDSDPHLERAYQRIMQASLEGEKVAVVGDYDADGACATTIMVDTLNRLNIETGFYIPNRLKEGYGISVEIAKQLIDKDYSLIITVDNGVKSLDVIEYCIEKNVDLIITDHHQLEEYDYPFLVHPTLMNDKYKTLCGAGVALILSRLLLNNQIIEEHYIYAMIATIGDVMPVFDENRIIIKEGLKFLNESSDKVITALFDSYRPYTEKEVAFEIVPKINSLGRLADVANINNLVRYFLSNEYNKNFIEQVNEVNKLRKKLSNVEIDIKNDLINCGGVNVFRKDDLHEGVIGIIAGRLSHQLKQPVLVMTKSDSIIKVSSRATDNYDLYSHLSKFKEDFTSFGGHKVACGISLMEEKYDNFLDSLSNERISGGSLIEEKLVDIESSRINVEFLEKLEQLRPFGEGLKLPKFNFVNFEYDSIYNVKQMYVKVSKSMKGLSVDAISFNSINDYNTIKNHEIVNFIGNFDFKKNSKAYKVNIVTDIFDF